MTLDPARPDHRRYGLGRHVARGTYFRRRSTPALATVVRPYPPTPDRVPHGRPHRGKELFAQRVEYPLPKKAGTKDYVFYFIPPGDLGYRDSGEKFFAKFYKGHVAKNVRTLEEMIEVLAAEVDSGVTRIREIVLLAHANPIGLLFKVVNGVSATNLREYKYVTAFSLACLQKDFEADKFTRSRPSVPRCSANSATTRG